MPDILDETAALTLKRQPWLAPRDGEIWEVTGKGWGFPGIHAPKGTKAIECDYDRTLCVVSEDGGSPVFLPFDASGAYIWTISPVEVTYARRLLLVDAATGLAYNSDEQDELEALQEAGGSGS